VIIEHYLMSKNNNNLYKSWFDTPFYHILYKNRDYKEAEMFAKINGIY